MKIPYCHFKKDWPEGMCQQWFENGFPRVEEFYKNRMRHGVYKDFHTNGQIANTCRYDNGKKIDDFIEFNELGNRI